jgi:hypothetical protein
MGVRNAKREELGRLQCKTLDAQFRTVIREGLNCSRFEAEAVPDAHLRDGGYLPWKGIEQASTEGLALEVPLFPTGGNGQGCTERKGDPPGVPPWRRRMISEVGKAIDYPRASPSETVNADLEEVSRTA